MNAGHAKHVSPRSRPVNALLAGVPSTAERVSDTEFEERPTRPAREEGEMVIPGTYANVAAGTVTLTATKTGYITQVTDGLDVPVSAPPRRPQRAGSLDPCLDQSSDFPQSSPIWGMRGPRKGRKIQSR
jgi:hypothetical protein